MAVARYALDYWNFAVIYKGNELLFIHTLFHT